MMDKRRHFFSLITSFILLLLPLNATFASTFPDVPSTHFNYNAVETLYSLNIIKGYDDGTFKPDKPVNRVEALKIILEMAKLPAEEADSSDNAGFFDVQPGAWYVKYVKKAKDVGIVKGNPDGSFAPDRQVNRAEFLKMLFLANNIDLTAFNSNENYPYSDIDPSAWYYPYMNYAIKYNIISPNESSLVEPGKTLTRGNVAETAYRLIILQRLGDIQVHLSEAESLLVQALNNLNNEEFAEAQTNTLEAVALTLKAKELAPDKSIVISAHKIAESMNKLANAYVYLSEENKEQALSEAQSAKNTAIEAGTIDSGPKEMIDKIILKTDAVINHAQN